MTCKHENTDVTADGKRTYCTDCGLRMVAPPGAVYYRALEDARRLKWQKITETGYIVHLGVVYIGARWNAELACWDLARVTWSEDMDCFELVQEGLDERSGAHIRFDCQYVAADELGVPSEPPVALSTRPGLSSKVG